MSNSLPRSTPQAQGVNPTAVTAFIDAIETAKLELHGFMLLRHGNVVAEGWWQPYGPQRPHMLFSLSKSFTSTAVGFAVAEGLLTVDDPVLKFFPEYMGNPGQHWDALKVRHLLTMTTGHKTDTTGYMVDRRDGDWVKGFFGRKLMYKPGTHFLYNTGATYMLSVIVQKLTGQRVLDYLTPRLLSPLGIEGADWQQCPKGHDTGGFGLSIRTEDIAKFGQFLLQRGMWQGKQLVPAAWVDEATSKQVENGPNPGKDWEQGYGYQFWRCVPDCYRGDGAFGQFCIVIPRLDAVVAINSGVGDMQAVMNHIWDTLLPGIGEPQPETSAAKAMADKLASLSYAAPAGIGKPATEQAMCCKAIKFEQNQLRAKSAKLEFDGDRCLLTLAMGSGKFTVASGRHAWVESEGPTPQTLRMGPSAERMKVASSFHWESETTLALTMRMVETPFTLTMRFDFNGSEAVLRPSLNLNMGPTDMPVAKGVIG